MHGRMGRSEDASMEETNKRKAEEEQPTSWNLVGPAVILPEKRRRKADKSSFYHSCGRCTSELFIKLLSGPLLAHYSARRQRHGMSQSTSDTRAVRVSSRYQELVHTREFRAAPWILCFLALCRRVGCIAVSLTEVPCDQESLEIESRGPKTSTFLDLTSG